MSDQRGRHLQIRGRHRADTDSGNNTRGRHIEEGSTGFRAPRLRPKTRLSVLTAALVLGLGVTAVFADTGSLNIEVPSKAGYNVDTTVDGAIVEYIGEDSAFGGLGASGTGVFESYLRTQKSPSEKGYNTDGTLEFDTKSGTHTRAILVSEIPVVDCLSADGSESASGLCWELFADVNDSNGQGGGLLRLTDLEIWFTGDDEITGYDFGGTDAVKVYDFEGTVHINDVNQGSGRGDIRYLIPLDELIGGAEIPTDCDYGNGACMTYFVTYTGWGDPADGPYATDGGFNEWKVKNYPFLTVVKTADTTFTRTFAWTIDKSVDPATWDLFDGDTGTSDWTVDLTKDDGTDSAWAVAGSIIVSNPSEQDAELESIVDSISGVGNISVSCGVTVDGFVLEPGDDLICTYSSPLPNADSRTNTATVTIDTGQVFTGDEDITFGSPTNLVNDTVDVTDTNGMSWNNVADDDSFTYEETFACDDDEGSHQNIATITQTGQTADATVTVNCYDLDVSKTTDESFSRDFDWSIVKTVDEDTLDLFDGDSGTVEWTITWTKGEAEDSEYEVSGDITITNNHPSEAATLTDVSDSISGIGDVTVNCPSLTVPANDSLVCTYESDLPDGATRTNTATATQQNYDYDSSETPTESGTTDYTGMKSVDFTGVTPSVTDDTATITDDRGPLNLPGEDMSGSTSYTETFDCGEDEGTYPNTAVVTEDDSGDDDDSTASVTVKCYELTVEKDAETSFSRDYDWDISKTRFIASSETDGDGDPATLTLDEGQTYMANYEVTVTMIGFTDDDHAVEGTITISNPAPMEAEGVSVSDVISLSGEADVNATVDCDPADGNQTTVDVPAASNGTPGEATCSYSADLPDAQTRLNTATATLFGVDYEGTDDVIFDLDNPTTEIDECIDIVDDAGTSGVGEEGDDIPLGTVCVGDLDGNNQWSDTYVIQIGPFAVCGEYEFTNTVSFETTDDDNDTNENGSDFYTVVVTVPCPGGCTLTYGYWKTHNGIFNDGKHDDPSWDNLMVWSLNDNGTPGDTGDDFWEQVAGSEYSEFFLSGLTYYEVLHTPVKGNQYFNLAHQYIAAQLNMTDPDGADGSAIATEFAEATLLFQIYTPEEIAALKGKVGKDLRAQFVDLAGTLADYNEGEIGPGHCDEDGTSGFPFLPIPIWKRGRHEHAEELDF